MWVESFFISFCVTALFRPFFLQPHGDLGCVSAAGTGGRAVVEDVRKLYNVPRGDDVRKPRVPIIRPCAPLPLANFSNAPVTWPKNPLKTGLILVYPTWLNWKMLNLGEKKPNLGYFGKSIHNMLFIHDVYSIILGIIEEYKTKLTAYLRWCSFLRSASAPWFPSAIEPAWGGGFDRLSSAVRLSQKHSQRWSGPLEMLQLNTWCSPLSSRIPRLPPSQIAPVPIRVPRGEQRRCIWGTVQLRGPMTEGRWHDASAAVTAVPSEVWGATGKVYVIGMRVGIYLWWIRTCKWRSPHSYPWSHEGFLLSPFHPFTTCYLPSLHPITS